MKFVFIIAVFCVVPCAFQDVWDYYDTWYDELNNLEDGGLAVNLDQPKDDQVNEPEPVENDENKEFHAADYDSDDNYRDYEIEDNRDEVKNKLEKEQEPNQEQDIEENDDNVESAVQDFDAFQQILNNDKLNDDVIDKILAVDEKSQMDLNDLLPEELSESENENLDAIPAIELDKQIVPSSYAPVFESNYEPEQVEETAVEQNENTDEKDVQLDIEDIRDETQQLLEQLGTIFDEDADNDSKDIPPEVDAQSNLQDIVDETHKILEDTNTDFDEIKDTSEEVQNGELPVAHIDGDMKSVMDETQQILDTANGEFNENKDAMDEQPIADVIADIKDIIGETHQILQENNNEFEENINKDEEQKIIEEVVKDAPVLKVEEIADDVDKVYEDLNEDLDKLLETWKKLSIENNDEVDDNSENADNDKVEVNADDDVNNANIGDDAKEKTDFDYEGETRILATRNDYYESIMDKDLSDLFKDFENDDDGDEKDIEKANLSAASSYGNDGLAAESMENNEQAVETKGWVPYEEENEDNTKPSSTENSVDEVDELPKQVEETTPAEEMKPTKVIKDVDELTSSELEELSQQFVMLHDSEIKMARDDTPIHITLTADEPVVITSPNYPNSYPTDQTVVDWILEGLGTGIEVNITDLAINSAQGHFLMLKPGQSDASGDSGLVFAYRINSERRYRFRDVNRLFVRFNPLGGISFSRGFQLSARMIESPVGDSDEELPEPEFHIPEPQHTATLLLAGVNSTRFLDLENEFRRLLADMATMYINANDVDPGLNTTNVVTQITRSYVCNVNWPGFDSCVQVTFGVPLVYEDEDSPNRLTESELMEMWDTYASRDPFAARLSSMGISDYTGPRDARILTVWVVMGVGVVIAAAMLAFALWRYSCIENYTRMQEFSDTDSIHDKKRGLDMYPTPHQTLPPLYSENDYKWADRTFDDSARVDMGGFTNNTFTRDEPSSESEDDVVVSRDRNSYKPRDFNVV